MLSVSIMWCPKTASSGKYQDTQHGTILIRFGSFLTMNMVLICETQKASFVLLKVAFHMLNEVEDFNWIRTLTSHFFYHDGINKTAACGPFSKDLSQLQSLLNDHGFSKANPFYQYPSVLGGGAWDWELSLPLRHPKMTYTKRQRCSKATGVRFTLHEIRKHPHFYTLINTMYFVTLKWCHRRLFNDLEI